LVGRDSLEKYEREIQRSFPCCPLCGSKKLKPNLVPGGRDSLSCESCKAQWHLIIGLGGLKWAELEHASENGDGKTYLGKRYEKGQWQKLAEKMLNSKSIQEPLKEAVQVIKEKEIIREREVIVKIRCPYCKNPFSETLDRCPHCGARA
jgi:hypothetical protein